ncbi:hypothetical protein [Miltoncostaea marina]|uniref:hypothetical protein n=1 Tax=Miltoncostaea marina TaxID=2843215 RepID=UPI001C3D7C0E|nr:hypothetical protein [Miltoncostaea marina]
MSDNGWSPSTEEHTFASGRVGTVRTSPNIYAIFSAEDIAPHLTDYLAGSLQDPALGLRISEEIVRAMLVTPRLLREEDPDAPDGVRWIDLDPLDIDELLSLFMERSERAARFRDDAGSGDDGADGAGVEDKPKRAARTKTGKR